MHQEFVTPRREAQELVITALGPGSEGHEGDEVDGPRRAFQQRRKTARDQRLGPRGPDKEHEVVVSSERCSVPLLL